MATGFHGFHVIVGTIFLIVCLFRAMRRVHARHHFGFEAAAWYWHFVDVVWLFLFFCIYWWGSGNAPTPATERHEAYDRNRRALPGGSSSGARWPMAAPSPIDVALRGAAPLRAGPAVPRLLTIVERCPVCGLDLRGTTPATGRRCSSSWAWAPS